MLDSPKIITIKCLNSQFHKLYINDRFYCQSGTENQVLNLFISKYFAIELKTLKRNNNLGLDFFEWIHNEFKSYNEYRPGLNVKILIHTQWKDLLRIIKNLGYKLSMSYSNKEGENYYTLKPVRKSMFFKFPSYFPPFISTDDKYIQSGSEFIIEKPVDLDERQLQWIPLPISELDIE